VDERRLEESPRLARAGDTGRDDAPVLSAVAPRLLPLVAQPAPIRPDLHENLCFAELPIRREPLVAVRDEVAPEQPDHRDRREAVALFHLIAIELHALRSVAQRNEIDDLAARQRARRKLGMRRIEGLNR